ncbi:unnamed protein product, partial [Phaeothamnion confervicola]
EAARADALRRVTWMPLEPPDDCSGGGCAAAEPAQLRPQEGHGAALLHGGRYVAIIGAWSAFDEIINDVVVVDARRLPKELVWSTARDVGMPPEPSTYGLGVCAVADDTLAVFGGLLYGGYKGEVNWLYLCRVVPLPAGAAPMDGPDIFHSGRETVSNAGAFVADWAIPSTAGVVPTGRGYHSFTACPPGAPAASSTAGSAAAGGTAIGGAAGGAAAATGAARPASVAGG